MRIKFGSRTPTLLGVVVMLAVLVLAGCGGGGSGSGSSSNSSIHITVGSKLDADGQLLGQMYALLLQQKGYTVTTKLALGQTPVLNSAIQSGAVDIYPEFTGTALSLLNQPQTQDAQAAYNTVKTQYKQKYNLDWLDAAYNLNDSYAICTSQSVAQSKHLTSLNDVAPIASQLTIASQQDGLSAAVDPVQTGYNTKFKNVVQISEQLGFEAVQKGNADLNVCYTTDPTIVADNFVVLKDTKNVFPIYNPAPIVRDQVLSKSSGIADALNPLAAKLTTSEQVALIKQVSVDKKSVFEVAKTYLQQQGLYK